MVHAGSRVVGVLLAGLLAAAGPARQSPPPSTSGPLTAAVAAMASDTNEGRRAALETILADLGVNYDVEPFSIPRRPNYPRTEGANLVVTLGSGNGDIVVGAHYDAVWLADGTLSRGAVDNAASAVVLAELARALRGGMFRHRIRIVFFDMEEIGLVGSRRYVEAHRGEIKAAINLDVNGYGDTIFYGPASEAGNYLLYDLMRRHCYIEGLSCMEFPDYPSSDYLSFQAAGIPNLSLSLLPELEAHQLWLYENGGREAFRQGYAPRVLEMIHSPADTPDRVEEQALALGLRSLNGLVWRLDSLLE